MSTPTTVELTDDERDDFLGEGGTGVISFGRGPDEAPHSIPVSYGYDRSEATFYFRLAVGEKSDKPPLTDRPVTFVTHGSPDGPWRSVVASGRLERTTEDPIATETLRGLDRVKIPYIDIFGRPLQEVAFEFYRLVPDTLTAREESTPVE